MHFVSLILIVLNAFMVCSPQYRAQHEVFAYEIGESPETQGQVSATRGKPDVEGFTLLHSFGSIESFLSYLNYLKNTICGNSIGVGVSDKQKQNLNGLMKSEKGNNSVSKHSVNACVENFEAKWVEIKRTPLEQLQRYLPPTVSNIVAGMVLGSQENISAELKHKIKVTGMQHVMVASGSNIGLVYYSSMALLSRFLASKKAALGSLFLVYGYLWIVGADPPVIRATLMATVMVIARVGLGRQLRALWSLVIVAMIMLAIDLEWLSSASFQLSFASSLSILLWMPLVPSPSVWLAKLDFLNSRDNPAYPASSLLKKLAGLFFESLMITIAAQFLTLPLVLFHFKEVGTLLVLANTVLVPLVPVITLSGFMFLLSSPILEGLYLSWSIHWVSLTVVMPANLFLEGLAKISLLEWPVLKTSNFPIVAVFGWWVVTLCLIAALYHFKRQKRKILYNFYLE